ncbi:MAG: iron ABC transporter substrate-binding protein [Actinomycetota bacterium]
MNRKTRGLAALASALALSLLLVGCASETPPSTDDQTLTIYSGRSEELIEDLLTKFTEETGVAVSVRYGDSAELAAQILEEGNNVRADVFFSQDAGALGALSEEGLLRKLPDEVLNLVDAKYRSDKGEWVGVSGRGRVIAYDPEKVTDLPTTYMDLTDPKWQGKIGIAPPNASFQAFVTAIRVIDGDSAAEEFLAGMKKNALLYEKNSQLLQAVEDGVIELALINHYYWFELAEETGVTNLRSKVAWFQSGDPGNLINVAGVGVMSENPAANEFAKWLLGPTAQQFFVEKTAEYSLTGIPPMYGIKPMEEIEAPKIDLSDLSSLSQTLELIRKAGLL